MSKASYFTTNQSSEPSSMSLSQIQSGGHSQTLEDPKSFCGSEFSEDNFVAKVKMEIVVIKDQLDAVIDLITEEARTGEIGDGKIFGEWAEQAERMSGGRYDMSSNKANV